MSNLTQAGLGGPARSGVRVFAVLVLATLFSVVGAGLWAPSASAQQQQEIDLGATVYLGGNTLGAAVEDFETLSQREFDVIRVFLLWDSPWPGTQLNALKASGHKIYLSVRANNLNGTKVSWADIAAAQPGSPLHNRTLVWANRVRNFGDDMYFAFHHEPENRDSIGNGNNVDYIAAWRKVVNVFRNNNVNNAEYAWTMTEFAFEVPGSDRRAHFKWYPGDAWVDHLAADAYNWANCRPEINNPWRSLERQIRDFVEFGRTKPDKGMMLAELATFEDPTDPNRKAQWINDARALFKQPGYEQFHTLAWYNHPQAGYPNCNWQVDTGPATLAAWRAFAADPFYGGGTPPTNNNPVAPSACSANGQGTASSTVSWTRAADDNATAFVIERRRGTGQWFWLARPSVPATSYVDTNRQAGVDYTYRIKTQRSGVNSTARVCTNTGNPGGNSPVAPSACSANGQGTASSTVSWTRAANDNATAFVIERQRGNGQWFWLARPSVPSTSFVDTNRQAGVDYTYRVKTQSNGVNSAPTVCTNTGNPVNNSNPAAPTSCTVEGAGTSVNVFWVRANPDSAANFIVERRRNGGQWFWLARVAAPANSFADSNRAAGSTYEYRVRTQSPSFVNSAFTNC